MSLLEINHLSVHYGGIQAVRDISFIVEAGETLCMIGANGAGKTSTLGAIAGLLPVAKGSLFFNGEDLRQIPLDKRASRGLVLVPEGRGIFPKLSVLENLQLGAYWRRDRAVVKNDLAKQLARFPRLQERQHQLAGTMSGGEQQLLAIARALMSRPKLLLLDEPSMGLAPIMVQTIFKTIQEIAAEGVTVLLIEQNSHLALQVSQRGMVLEHGEIILSDASAALRNNCQVQAAYLGG
jgi:branched-chain amino acid transport system ATP-binding protein